MEVKAVLIRSNEEYKELINKITKQGLDVSGTYELSGVLLSIPTKTTEEIKDIFEITDKEAYDFVEAISTLQKKQMGPYDTSKYFSLIPGVKEAARQLVEDCVETRRCVVKFPTEHCFQDIQFLVRENTVQVICYMRSCNAIKNLPFDIWICSFLADVFKDSLNKVSGTHPYKYHTIKMIFGSLHVFQEDMQYVL